MPLRLNPYITFAGDAREAMEFYQAALGGELAVNTFGEYGDAGPDSDKIMHANLETPDGFTLMASDPPPGLDSSQGSSITVSLSGEDEDKLRGFWDKLTEGAEIHMPLERQMWGDVFGQFTDKFGTQWMVNITAHRLSERRPARRMSQSFSGDPPRSPPGTQSTSPFSRFA